MRIMVVEDDPSLANLLRMVFELDGFAVDVFATGEQALKAVEQERPDLLILDVMLPGIDGFEIQRRIRSRGIPIIFLTAKTHLQDRLQGLKLGADDYITKPFHQEELLLRVKALLNRVQPRANEGQHYQLGRLVLKEKEQAVYLNGQIIPLTASEYLLLRTLMEHHRAAVGRDHLLRIIWEVASFGDTTRTVDAHMQRIRKKLGPYRRYIKTVYGVGYRLDVTEDSP